MRRISLKYAKPSMVLGAPVYDNYGTMLLDEDTRLDKDCLEILLASDVPDILLDDYRVTDVVIKPLVSPELEGKAAHALRRLMFENQGKESIADSSLDQVAKAVKAMIGELGDVNVDGIAVAGIVSQENYIYIQPVKTAVVSLSIGRSLGYGTSELADLGTAVLLKDIGYISIPKEILHRPELLTEKELLKIRQHPMYGYELLSQHRSTSGSIANAVLQHHERWNGAGYPYGLKQADISPFAQVIAIADTYTALLSKRPGRKVFASHEAIEYIMAYSGEQFNPDLAQVFVREVPCYSTGLTVKLNTGEIGIVSDPNLDFIGRPTVRIIYDEDNGKVRKPYEIDLSKAEYQHKMITEVMDYY